MRWFFAFLAAACAGVLLGLFATSFILRSGFSFDTLRAGPWASLPRAPASGADPYARAQILRSAFVPLAPAEGISFLARMDQDGARLVANCTYTISGRVPASRLWTLTLLTTDGTPLDTKMRQGFTSAELLRDEKGTFNIALSRSARPGNALLLPQDGRFLLLLRFYDLNTSLTAHPPNANDLPSIRRESCG